ncbi:MULTISPECIES: phosphate signaling complex protein PhoU [unclassified Marinobacterium]|jgi:phosphate transport system protein|uniref:phosphate signaling complex protein PhoU n=1 Tax=unclassified Marinobacterium TaxID=2644139 RepID=UPI001567D829|nr:MULTISPECIES: phosphate signaling complex protein PhoU [unclassified Marinobacterium]NRP10786.1 Phosphate-specific transport system accessory protein PhoU [Marinobacterium sp. xm-g-48]NRP14934.1 Phosphate-specific transport system accessory protein PhoU [Marinobacterium sp. xm-a-152]NRP27442.1 Phosphate-specific transport system accessory protein PhoU [Marinobacterium sp. xm-d-420]NRP36708.1 Phosphate-specific transport system accessory protein PhoU [Marinobacterium sp. xm-d-579]NRP38661.1 
MRDSGEIYSQHTSNKFNEELERLRSEFLEMGRTVKQQVTDSLHALLNQDISLAESTRELDRETNRFENQIDKACEQIIALRQPAAVDLRLVLSINRAIVDLERIGDEASRVAKQAIDLSNNESSSKSLHEVSHIGEMVTDMLNSVLIAFENRDIELAYKVVKSDKHVDREYQSTMRALITFMMEDSRSISGVLNIIWILRALERIGDHACNLAEQVIYQVSGTDVRHMKTKEIKKIVRE